jgi:hypothetical protein
MNILDTIETYAKDVALEAEQLIDTDFKAFLTLAAPLYNDLKALAVATGKADVATLLTDLKTDVVAAATTAVTSGGNSGAVIASVATNVTAQAGELVASTKNALYGALAIVAQDVPGIGGAATPATPAVAS